MKKKILGVCFCLLAMASMSMAAATHDSILNSGNSNDNDPMEWLADYLNVSSDYLADSLFSGATGWYPGSADMVSMDPEFDSSWDYLVLISDDSGIWYVFADDYSDNMGDGFADGLLTTPFMGADFNNSGVLFDNAWGFASPAPVPEPGSLLLLGSGVIGLGLVVKRRINK